MLKETCRRLKEDIEDLKVSLAAFKELFDKDDFDRAGDHQVDYEITIRDIRYQLQGLDFVSKIADHYSIRKIEDSTDYSSNELFTSDDIGKKITVSRRLVRIEGDIAFVNKDVKIELPYQLHIGGNLDLQWSAIDKIPEYLYVSKSLTLSYKTIKQLPDTLRIGGDLIIIDDNDNVLYNQAMVLKERSYIKGKIIQK